MDGIYVGGGYMFYRTVKERAINAFKSKSLLERLKITPFGLTRFLERDQIIGLYNWAVSENKRVVWDEGEFCYSYQNFEDVLSSDCEPSWIRSFYALELSNELSGLRFLDAVSKAKEIYGLEEVSGFCCI